MRGRLIPLSLVAFAVQLAHAQTGIDSLTAYYARHDIAAIERLYDSATTWETRLLCSYRLYPLTEDERWLEHLPDAGELTTARELALLAAHWGFKAQRALPWQLPTFGRRSEEILRRAQAMDADEPYVLLVDGQSLYYKPGIFGGDVDRAKARFEQLRNVMHRNPTPGIHRFEPEVWIWICLRKAGSSAAAPLRRQLITQNPPPLFRRFLNNPPD
ncbi:MAG: hypothetical protein R3284_07565 [Rubricoccaceae bacterium]|nr:hypothetical protein [Rubricoccaceae bacterium]